ncbi:DNA integrity scanning diadenylate cyclase DisA [Neobacillus kokaensis]|uniref:DNA integrity scanning protein DisA n=1 Tax=Neobacillus kokaensis TaxID=2759023 RepID=A0ABQ3N9L6_9BACI|nr:DNA integrity scanning diadenylate cyclase DisA [Neobacillus kokaensis]GHI00523.1 DNA integrity scanning protein DisA [Neobacillus kokaensis]
MEHKKPSEQTITDLLQLIAPGTPIREGLDNVLRANTGGLIVIGYNDKVKSVVDGGFAINCAFSPSFLYELAKMDGAIILNDSASKILIANGQLAPDPLIPSSETGMRHRTAERVAKQTKALVIAISQRRNVITLYQGNHRYALKDIAVILTKANQAIQTLEKYKAVMEQTITNFSILEFEESVTYNDFLLVLHRFEMVLKIKNELLTYLYELGTEGRLIRLQMNEILTELEEEIMLIIKDYAFDREVKPEEVLQRIQAAVNSTNIEDMALLKLLGYNGYVHLDENKKSRGYRILHKIPRLPAVIIENLIGTFGDLCSIIAATVEDLDDVEGIGEVRAKKIKEGFKLIRERLYTHRYL